MRVVVQRVSQASVSVEGQKIASISKGLLLLLGVEDADGHEDIAWLSKKILQLRIFGDAEGKMNLSIQDIGGQIIVVSQFTLHASTKKGNRPSFIRAAKPAFANENYLAFIEVLKQESGLDVQSGSFGAMMDIELINSGPVTIIIDTKNKE